jgi:hypothetical protein
MASTEGIAMSQGYMSQGYMSQGYERDFSQHGEPPQLTWERVVFRQGDGRYVFEVAEGGLHAKLTSPHGTSLTLPMVAWEGLLDALVGARKARTRNERGFPARSGARWYDGEAGELAAGFRAGRTISQLARAHNRSEYAIEAELDRLGLWDRIARLAIVPGDQLMASQGPVGEPEPGPTASPRPAPHRDPRADRK